MLNKGFYEHLAFTITKLLEQSNDPAVKGFWCDGIVETMHEVSYSKKFINDNRKIILKVFIGKTGQDEYELVLHFGPQALSKHARDLDLADCIPHVYDENLFFIDTNIRKLEILLL
jgi:hypothetical protein